VDSPGVGLDGEPGAGYGSSEGRAGAGAGAAGVPQWYRA